MATANKHIKHLKSLIVVLPNKPGVYQYFNEQGKIIYVGKAKNLKKGFRRTSRKSMTIAKPNCW